MPTTSKKPLSSTKATIIGIVLFLIVVFIIGLIQTAGNTYENIIRPTEITPAANQPTLIIPTPASTITIKTPVK